MKIFLKSITVLIFILSSSTMQAQTGHVSGTVIDSDFNEPLAFTNITVIGMSSTTSSDFDGMYSIDLKPGKYTLVFSFAGYKTLEIDDVIVTADKDIQLDVTLATRTINTEAITSSVDSNND
ncbi:MAG: carboxypeptidase-like regulatory domain-containing protein [Flavobacteriaceae bacterium]|nr:carboxypeptidase-like regulatory domain-containing protein [Flavobacteriaceae bacterium]